MQLNLFDVNDLQQAKEKKQAIYERLKYFGVDDYYIQNIAGRYMLLNVINDKLSNLSNYQDYYMKLVGELKKVVPTVMFENFKFGREISCLIKHDDNKYNYYCKYINKLATGEYGPLFCLAQIPDDFFA